MSDERYKAVPSLPEDLTAESVFSTMATQSIRGLCFAIELLDLPDTDRVDLERLLFLVDGVVLDHRANMGRVVGNSITQLKEHVLKGELDPCVTDYRVIQAIVGLARTAQILDGQMPTNVFSSLGRRCYELLQLAREHKIVVGSSTLELMHAVLIEPMTRADND